MDHAGLVLILDVAVIKVLLEAEHVLCPVGCRVLHLEHEIEHDAPGKRVHTLAHEMPFRV